MAVGVGVGSTVFSSLSGWEERPSLGSRTCLHTKVVALTFATETKKRCSVPLLMLFLWLVFMGDFKNSISVHPF